MEAAHQSTMEIEGRCCLCREVLPLDRRRKKCLHGNNCIAAKSTIKALLTEPLEENDALNDYAAAICSNCERTVNNIQHYQSKIDSLKKKVMQMLSSLTSISRRFSATGISTYGGPSQAKKPCLDSVVAPTGDDISVSTSTCSPEVKVKLITRVV